jgi:hypothetical protein
LRRCLITTPRPGTGPMFFSEPVPLRVDVTAETGPYEVQTASWAHFPNTQPHWGQCYMCGGHHLWGQTPPVRCTNEDNTERSLCLPLGNESAPQLHVAPVALTPVLANARSLSQSCSLSSSTELGAWSRLVPVDSTLGLHWNAQKL